MANIFLETNEVYEHASSDDTITGVAGGSDALLLQTGVTGTSVGGNIDRVDLPGAAADTTFSYKATTGQLELSISGSVVASFRAGLNSAVDVRFTDGNATLTQTGAATWTLEDPADDTDTVTVEDGSDQTGDNVTLGSDTSATGDEGETGTTYTLTGSASSVTEGNSITYTVTADAAVAADTDFTFSVQGDTLDGAATAGSANDVSPASGTVTIAAGETSATFTVAASTDGISEGLEGIKVSLLDSENSLVDSLTATISDSEEAGGQTFVLTTENNSETFGVDNVTGTDYDDSINGTSDSLHDYDNINGGLEAEDGDEFNLSLTAGGQEFPTVSNVEIFNLRSSGTATNIVDFTDVSGEEQIWYDNGSQDLVLNNVGELATVGIMGGTGAGSYEVNFVDSLTTGTADVLDVSLDGADIDNLQVGGNSAAGGGVYEFETINIMATGNASKIDGALQDSGGFALAALTTLNISGDGDLGIDGIIGNATTIDGNEATGDLDLVVDDGDNDVTTGSGEDTIDVSNDGTLSANDTIDGGEQGEDEADTLIIGDSLTSAATVANVSNIEQLELNAATGVNTITYTVDTSILGADTATVVQVADTDDDNDDDGDLDNGDTLEVNLTNTSTDQDIIIDDVTGSVDGTDMDLANDADTDDGLNIDLSMDVTQDTSDDTMTIDIQNDYVQSITDELSKYENLNIMSTVGANNVQTLAFTNAETITITGDKNLTIAGLNMAAYSAADSVTPIVDASAFTGDLDLTFANDEGRQQVTAGSGDDTVAIQRLDANDTLDGGDGSDDTLSATDVTGSLGEVEFSGFETLNLDTATGTTTLQGDLRNLTTLENLRVDLNVAAEQDQDVTFEELANGVAVEIEDDFTGTAHTLTLEGASGVGRPPGTN